LKYNAGLTPTCSAMFVFVNYCADMFRLQMLDIFRKLAIPADASPYVEK